MTSFPNVEAVLQAAKAEWTGCDWDTDFGSRHANLRGLRSRQARLAAQATRGDESGFWRDVCHYLELAERDAQRAAELARLAVESWQQGDHATALSHLDQAISLEAQYRQPVTYPKLRALIAESMSPT